ncbi:MAG TPA: response regulator [Gaiellaceae bacterium]|nr:response regulator [Gaiellaceae bacterium]
MTTTVGNEAATLSVLLIEDDDDDYLLTRDLVTKLGYDLERVSDYAAGVAALRSDGYDICLVDYRLGAENGIDLVRELVTEGCETPMIVLTGQGDYNVDLDAANAGASDYLVKGEIAPALLERTIRYAVQTHAHAESLRRQEELLRQSQRMEAVGQLAAGIAHDFNNLLQVIRGYGTLIVERTSDDDVTRQAVEISRAADRAADLTQQLLAYSRQQILQQEPADLNVLVQETLRMLERLIGENVEVHRTYEEDLPTIVVDRGQISQVIVNLTINARDAMPSGGSLIVQTRAVELDDQYAREHPDVTPGRYVLLEIADTGIGMDAETRERIFDPYFTTKESGTGLGLATVYGIVRQSGGHIWLYSEAGIGTTFKIYFPAAAAAAMPPGPSQEPGALDGTETILVVEDADAVRDLVKTALESFGYTVIATSNGADALEIVRDEATHVDLVFTDMVMPGMNGRELAEQIEDVRPSVKLLFSSGYSADTVIRQGIASAAVAFIQKPYLSIELVEKIRSVLDAD